MNYAQCNTNTYGVSWVFKIIQPLSHWYILLIDSNVCALYTAKEIVDLAELWYMSKYKYESDTWLSVLY